MKYVILFGLLVSCCFARIGETKAQCDKRYGSVIGEKDGAIIYQAKEIMIIVRFHNKICQVIVYQKFQKGNTKDLSDIQIDLLLKENAGKSIFSSNGIKSWVTSDKYLAAKYNEGKQLVIITKSLFDWQLKQNNIKSK